MTKGVGTGGDADNLNEQFPRTWEYPNMLLFKDENAK